MIPKTFAITLRETEDRSKHLKEQLILSGVDAQIVYGPNGYKMGLAPVNPDILNRPTEENYITLGAIGNYLAHINVWGICESRNEDEFFIIEDDVTFVDGFKEKFEELYSQLPDDWQMAYVGWIPWGDGHEDEELITKGIVRKKVGATHAYLIKKSIIPLLIQSAYPMQTTIDVSIMNRVWDKANVYVFDPSLVSQKSYANGDDTTWVSLIYNWTEDAFRFKNGIYRQIKIGSGWYKPEKNVNSAWRWTSQSFSIRLPKRTTEMHLDFVSEFDNVLTIDNAGDAYDVDIKKGRFSVNIGVSGDCLLKLSLDRGFMPSDKDPNSSDNRNLGLCIHEMRLKFGDVEIPINIELL
jgi:GR25 family glycosyltransferase involved in LPS biosynthesis